MFCRNLNFTSTNNPANLFVLTVSIFTHHLVPNITPLCHFNSKQLCWTYLQHVDATHVAFTHDTTPLMELYIFIFGAQNWIQQWGKCIICLNVGNTIDLTSTPTIHLQSTYTFTRTCIMVVDIPLHCLHSIEAKP